MKKFLTMLGVFSGFGMSDSFSTKTDEKIDHNSPNEKIDHNSPKWRLREYFYSLPMQDRELIEKSPNNRIEGEPVDVFIFRMSLKKSL